MPAGSFYCFFFLFSLLDAEGNYRIRPVDQRASRVPPAYRLLAAKADVKWNRLAPDSGGPFQRYLASLPPVIGLAFGACSEWSQSVDRLIGQTAELGSKCPERFGCFMGRFRRKGGWPCGCVAHSTVRCCGSSLGAAIRRSTAPSSALLRRTRVIPRSAVALTAALRSQASGMSSTGLAIARRSRAPGVVRAAPRRCVFGATSGRPSRLDYLF